MTPTPQLRSVANPQLGFDETPVSDPTLESALEERQAAKEALREVRSGYKQADTDAKREIEKQELPEGRVIRVGRFRVERKAVAAKHVSFDTDASSRLTISVIGED